MADKKVIVEVEADADVSDVEPLEKKINELKQKRLNFEIETNTKRLDEVKAKIAELENKKATLDVDADDAEIKKIDAEIEALKFEEIDLNLKTAQAKVSLDEVESEMRSLEDNEIEVNLRNQSAMEALDQISQGFDRLKQGASEVGQAMGDVLESAGRMEQTESFLSMNLGADVAKKKLEEIRSVTDKLPGDDVTLQNLLSQAALKDANMTTEAFTQMGTAAADYMAAMQNYGKSATETQQDLMNYILAGNTAEIERSPILQSHIDKLKEGTTVQERAKLLQEALTAEGWSGIASQDIYNNKLQQFNDMIERGKMNLGGMFLEGSEGAMDFILKLDEMSGGLVGMAVALGSFASPLTDTIMGLGQMATGINAIKDLGFIKWLKDLEIMTKLSAAADWLLAGAQAVLYAVMALNPIVLVVLALVALAAALVWAYYNVDWFREAVDNAWASIVQLGQEIYGALAGALEWLSQAFTNAGQSIMTAITNTVNWVITSLQGLWNYIITLGGLIPANVDLTGNQVINTVLRVIAFIATLPVQLAMIFVNIIAQALGFGNNFSQTLINGAIRAVTGFIGRIRDGVSQFASAIQGIPNALQNCLDWAYNMVMNHPIVQAVIWLGNKISEVFSSIGMGQGSPGKIYRALENELNWSQELIEKNSKLPSSAGELGKRISDKFGSPELEVRYSSSGEFANGSIQRLAESQGNTQEINIIINGDIDNEDRLQYFVERIRSEMNWNNRTAGRSV